MERSHKTHAYKEKKYGRSTRRVLVAALKTVQDPVVPYLTVPYSRMSGGWSTVTYRTISYGGNLYGEISKISGIPIYNCLKNASQTCTLLTGGWIRWIWPTKGLGHVPLLDKLGRHHNP